MAVRPLVDHALAPRRPAVGAGHVGLGPRLVDEDEAVGFGAWLPRTPGRAALLHVRAVLFRRMDRLFLYVSPCRRNAWSTAETPQSTPSFACSSAAVASGC